MSEYTKIQFRRANGSPGTVLDEGEPGFDKQNNKVYVGKGTGQQPIELAKKTDIPEQQTFKTVGGTSIIGSGNIPLPVIPTFKTIDGQEITGSGNIVVSSNSTSKLKDKKVLFFGDSITEQAPFYRNDFVSLTGINTVGSLALSGASLRHNGAVDTLDGNPTSNSKNTVPNQIQKLLNNIDDYETPDIVIISAATNDDVDISETYECDETQFTSDGTTYIDVDTCDITTFSGAMRWIYEKIRTVYPSALVVFCTPIQAKASVASSMRSYEVLSNKRKVIISICERMSVPYIDAFTRSGIYNRYENFGAEGKYLKDGVHPNAAGAKILAKCYARELEYLVSMDEASSESGDPTPRPYTLTISKGTGVNTITVTRTSTVTDGVNTGVLTNGSNIYIGDVLTIAATALSGYTLNAIASPITVNGNTTVSVTSSGEEGGGDTPTTFTITANSNTRGDFALVAKSGSYNIEKFTPQTNGGDGEITWEYCTLNSSIYDATHGSTISTTIVSQGTISDGDYIENIVIDATHILIFRNISTTGTLNLMYSSGNTSSPFVIQAANTHNITKNDTFFSGYAYGGEYIFTSL